MNNMQTIIPVSQIECQVKSWKTYLKEAISDPLVLLNQLNLSPEQMDFNLDLSNPFATRVPQPFVDKMRRNDPLDPLLLQVIAQSQENDDIQGYIHDPLQEVNLQPQGLLHKYQGRVLLILASACAINCRYCFRRHYPYQDKVATGKLLKQAFDHIANDTSITEVILSGGDPLIVSDTYLDDLIQQLEQIPQLKRLRIHTRLPIAIPQRITLKLCQILQKSRLHISMVLHINHPNEIDNLLKKQLNLLTQANVTLLNQSVLLKSINDDINTLCQLSENLFSAGVLPYYIHLLDKVAGAAHFDINENTAKQLINDLRKRLPGYLVPRLAKEEASKDSKTIII